MDKNKNGKLEKSEVKEFTKQTMQVVNPEKKDFDEAEFEANFTAMDKNADGTVSKDELLASLIKKAQESGALAEGQWRTGSARARDEWAQYDLKGSASSAPLPQE